jgi:hypothetical protein
MRFKPIFERFAYANANVNITFCLVNVNDYRDIGRSFAVTSVPQFSFYLNGREHKKQIGASEEGFRAALNDLENEVNKIAVKAEPS